MAETDPVNKPVQAGDNVTPNKQAISESSNDMPSSLHTSDLLLNSEATALQTDGKNDTVKSVSSNDIPSIDSSDLLIDPEALKKETPVQLNDKNEKDATKTPPHESEIAQSSEEPLTLHTNDLELITDQSLENATQDKDKETVETKSNEVPIETERHLIDSLQKENDKLVEENRLLKQQIELRKEQATLQTADIIAQVSNWVSETGLGQNDNSPEKYENTAVAHKSYQPDKQISNEMFKKIEESLGYPQMESTPKKVAHYKAQINKEASIFSDHKKEDSSSGIPYEPESLPEQDSKVCHEDTIEALSHVTPTRRIIGELAFQLDRRILTYVFCGKHMGQKEGKQRKRFYGYTTANVIDKIRYEAIDKSTAMLNTKKEMVMKYRYDYIINSLRPLGFTEERHPEFITYLINKYGLLSAPPDKNSARRTVLDDPKLLRKILRKILPTTEIKDALVLLDCLQLLAHDDQMPLFRF